MTGNEITKTIRIPTIDISGETHRHVVIARGTEKIWQGHPHTLLMPDGRTMYCVWQGRQDGSGKHGAPGGLLKRSNDGGLTWSNLLDVPKSWREKGRGHPTIHRLVDGRGKARLYVFCRDEGRTTFLRACSEDGGSTWSDMEPLPLAEPNGDPITGWTAPISILETTAPDGRRRHLMWYERSAEGSPSAGIIWQSASYDGGLTWGESKPVVDAPGASEPAAVRSPDGKQVMLFIREQTKEDKKIHSHFSVSNDEGESWSEAKTLPMALTGDRHLARYAPDGRLVVTFRGRTERNDKNSHFTAWVGRYEDIVEGCEGEFRIKLLHSYAGTDHTYPGLEVLPDGTFVATTYIKYTPGEEMHSVVSVRFKLDEL